MAKKQTILIAGGTGLIGRQTIPFLLHAGHKVISIGRRKPNIDHENLQNFIIDFNDFTDTPNVNSLPLPKIDIVISTLGTTLKKAGSKAAFTRVDHDYVLALAKLGKAYDADHMITVSSVSADAKARSFYLKTKGEVETALMKEAFNRLDILRPGLLLGDRQEFRLGEKIAASILPLMTPITPSKYRAIHAEMVASAMTTLIQNTSQSGIFMHHNSDIKRLAARSAHVSE